MFDINIKRTKEVFATDLEIVEKKCYRLTCGKYKVFLQNLDNYKLAVEVLIKKRKEDLIREINKKYIKLSNISNRITPTTQKSLF